jgi:hypothetical protein
LLEAEWEVYFAMRKNVGVEPLTREMLRVFGQRSQ